MLMMLMVYIHMYLINHMEYNLPYNNYIKIYYIINQKNLKIYNHDVNNYYT